MADPLAIQNMPNLMQALSDPLHMQNLPSPQMLVQALAGEVLPTQQTTVGAMAPETIAQPAVRFGEETWTGPTHATALLKAQDAAVDRGMKRQAVEDTDFDWGWTTSHGRFVDSEQALKIAKGAGQITDPEVQHPELNILESAAFNAAQRARK